MVSPLFLHASIRVGLSVMCSDWPPPGSAGLVHTRVPSLLVRRQSDIFFFEKSTSMNRKNVSVRDGEIVFFLGK